jgi:hypothetical protein
VGHLIGYFASESEKAVRRWLDDLKGFYCSDPGEVPVCWEGELQSGGTFWAHIAPAACNFSLRMNYTGLYHGQEAAVEFAGRFETEFWERVGPVPLLRLDEYLPGDWVRATGREWWELEAPVQTLRGWLRSQESHWDWLMPDAPRLGRRMP